ncbi:hypothetical protein FO519_006972 [Halicephalobus sp. NKZ332]|nr:hypothetical protein FO519_006972 [Halicephalobus sp. NKZ332]
MYVNANNITLFNKVTCFGVNGIQGLGISGSKTVLVAIAFDRFMAVYKPLHYSKNQSRLFVYFVAGVAIFFAMMSTTTSAVGLDNSTMITVCSMGAVSSKTLAPIGLAYSSLFLFLLFCIGALIKVSYSMYANANHIVSFEKTTCLGVNTVQVIGIQASKTVLVAIAFDRFMAVFKPLHCCIQHYDYGILFYWSGQLYKDFGMLYRTCNFENMGSIFYILAIFFIIYRRHPASKFSSFEKKEFRMQLKIFVTVSLILFLCFLTYGIPTILIFVGLVYDVGANVRTYAALYSALGTLTNATLNVFLYLFKHNEIHNCSVLFFSENFPILNMNKSMIFTIPKSHSKTSKT